MPTAPFGRGRPTGSHRFTSRIGSGYQHNNTEYTADVSPQRLASLLGLEALPSTPTLPPTLTGNPAGTNYAVAGYETVNIFGSVTAANGSANPVGPVFGNGYLVDVPRVDTNALFFINGGGDDVCKGTIVDQATAASSAANLVAAVAALQSAGAKVIIVSDLLDVGLTPRRRHHGQSYHLVKQFGVV
jgi:outer membrane lipase/esterase